MRVKAKALRLGQDFAIFHNQAVAGPHQVGGRFVGAGAGVEISGQAAGRLLPHQVAPVAHFAQQLVAGRGVEQQRGSGQGQIAAGRVHGPQIFANLNAHHGVGQVLRGEEQVGPKGDWAAVDGDGVWPGV